MTATRRECGCPWYVARCAHFEGKVVWLLTAADSRKEYLRRTGVDPFGMETWPCCGSLRGTNLEFDAVGIVGPGFPTSAGCACRLPLRLADYRNDDLRADSLELGLPLFEERARAMREAP